MGKCPKPGRNVAQPTPIPPWRDLSEADARSTVTNGQSLLVPGPPGTGKTYYVRELVRVLRKLLVVFRLLFLVVVLVLVMLLVAVIRLAIVVLGSRLWLWA